MAQGTIKSKPRASGTTTTGGNKSSSRSRSNGITKKGGRTVAPKKLGLIKAQKMTKKVSGGLTAQTEKMLGARAGHLELLGQGGKKKKPVGGGGGGEGKGDPKKEGWKEGGKKVR